MKHQLTKSAHLSYKIGVDEIVGLKAAMIDVLKPIQKIIKNKVYWNDCELEAVEYKRRDGFIPHSHNCGGVEFSLVIPKCEEYEFGFIEFGECDGCADDGKTCLGDDTLYPENGGECGYISEGHLDALLRVRLKFEGIQDDGSLQFYLFLEGGNNDAPYFRNVPTVFEAEFSCKTVSGLKRAAAKHVKALIKAVSHE
jgi:hypothetical protein